MPKPAETQPLSREENRRKAMAAVQSIFERYTFSSPPLHSHRLRDTRVVPSQLTNSTDQSLLKLPPRPGPRGPGLRQRHHGQGRDPRRLDRTPSPTSPVLVGAGPAGRRRRLVVHEQAAHRARERQLQRRHARGRRGGHLRHAHHHRAGADCQARVLDVSSSLLLLVFFPFFVFVLTATVLGFSVALRGRSTSAISRRCQ